MLPDLNRIFYVEDEADIQTIAQMALEADGLTVEVCSSGEEAVKRVPGFAPDLILLDVMMPGMDGPSTFKALRKLPQTATTPIVFMTAKSQSPEIAQYKALGAIDVIIKPFDPMTLASSIRRIWAEIHG